MDYKTVQEKVDKYIAARCDGDDYDLPTQLGAYKGILANLLIHMEHYHPVALKSVYNDMNYMNDTINKTQDHGKTK